MEQAVAVNHYTSYRPKPFTREQRERTTILFGGLTWKHERLVQGTMQNLGYNAQPLPNIARRDLDAGKELIDVGACCPTVFTTGNLVNFLKSEVKTHGDSKVVDKFVFLTAGACGPCRFGQYHESYAMALDGMGLRDFRMFLLAQDNLDQGASDGGGLEVNMPLSLGLVWALMCGDVLTDLEYMTRPYEVVGGETDRVLTESVEYMYEAFRHRPRRGKKWGALAWHLLTDYFASALRVVRKKWDGIEVDRLQIKPKIKITGEFWLQTHEGDGNYNIKRWLEQERAEVIPPPIAVWLEYLMQPKVRQPRHARNSNKSGQAKMVLRKVIGNVYRATYDRFRGALGNLPYELADQKELRDLADPFYHFELRGGEGHMLIGKALAAYQHKSAHMVCELSPYSCMPNTMSVGAMAAVLGRYPDLLYAPIEVKGDAEVHAKSRCQMVLTEAKKRAQVEFDQALQTASVTVEEIRKYEGQHPEVRTASYRVPHLGYAGTSANYVAHLARGGKVGHR